MFAAYDLAHDIAGALNCAELDALTALLRENGYTVAADDWKTYHADGDDEGDAHDRTPSDALRRALDAVTTAAHDLTLHEEDPDTFGPGHIVIRTDDGGAI